ncbi:PREDICTED: MICAL-like protein 1 [Chinchilla lanigera]|uniref:MICAL-like protein 1 n=1 Tax=Chinchilla lanigera TaxID=34839 RepID=UPI000698BEFD|nr:PREDICTED: MICAL-like protein 1 [Chinchilla lanigera]
MQRLSRPWRPGGQGPGEHGGGGIEQLNGAILCTRPHPSGHRRRAKACLIFAGELKTALLTGPSAGLGTAFLLLRCEQPVFHAETRLPVNESIQFSHINGVKVIAQEPRSCPERGGCTELSASFTASLTEWAEAAGSAPAPAWRREAWGQTPQPRTLLCPCHPHESRVPSSSRGHIRPRAALPPRPVKLNLLSKPRPKPGVFLSPGAETVGGSSGDQEPQLPREGPSVRPWPCSAGAHAPRGLPEPEGGCERRPGLCLNRHSDTPLAGKIAGPGRQENGSGGDRDPRALGPPAAPGGRTPEPREMETPVCFPDPRRRRPATASPCLRPGPAPGTQTGKNFFPGQKPTAACKESFPVGGPCPSSHFLQNVQPGSRLVRPGWFSTHVPPERLMSRECWLWPSAKPAAALPHIPGLGN